MKAQSHLEFMISLIVFVGFVIFIFYIVNPFSKPSAEINKISLIEKSILNNISDEVIIVKIIQGTNSGACYLTSEIDKFGNKWIKKQDGRIFTFYINNKFPNGVSDDCLTPDYTIAPEVKEDFIIFEDIVNFKSLYIIIVIMI